MKKTLILITAAILFLLIPTQPASADNTPPVQNFGQCSRILVSLGISPSEFRPPVSGGGPAVVFPSDNPLQARVVGADEHAFFLTVACHFEPPEPTDAAAQVLRDRIVQAATN